MRQRADSIMQDTLLDVWYRTDRTVVFLSVAQWAAALILAFVYSAYSWQGTFASVHLHVYLAVFMGAALCVPVVLLTRFRPGSVMTRHSIAVTQLLWSGLFVHLTNGRIETHFHIFCSLAFLAFYRDIGVLLSGAGVVILDHFFRGLFLPQSIYGAANAEWWRFLEHGFWVSFEVAVLSLGVRQNQRDLKLAAQRQFEREALTASIEQMIDDRTRDLNASRELYRSLVESTRAIPFSWDLTTNRVTYVGPQAEALLDEPLEVWLSDDFFVHHIHPDDLSKLTQLFKDGPPKHLEIDYRLQHHAGHWVPVRSIASPEPNGSSMRGFFFDITAQRKLEHDLRQSQKLESVGRLASGVAHEINTPIQFVGDSLHFIRDACGDLFSLIGAHSEVTRAVIAGQPAGALALAANKENVDVDLDYLLDQVPKAVVRTLDGVDRVATIVRSMKVFAHPDSADMQPIDLNENIRSTLTIAHNEYKYVADLVCHWGVLPPVVCFCSELNQVVLNLVTNAAHAIADKTGGGVAGRGQISVTTREDGEAVVIDVADTGGGIPLDVRDRIFDPFFTTKEVGRGTGQGLAIARSVICDKHHGSLSFDSEVGVGTVFHVRIPIHGRAA